MKQINELARHINPIRELLHQAVSRVIDSGWYVLGPEVESFERNFAAYCASEHCVSLANGTDALELALRSLGIVGQSKVLTVANAGMYSTAAIFATGGTPVYADVHSDTSLIDVSDAKRLIADLNVDAVVVTHLYGLMAEVQQIVHFARSKSIPVVEDCAQAHGAMKDGKKAGTFGDVGCFSFYPTKNLGALGDGGAIVTNRSDVAMRVKQLRQYGWESKYRTTLAGGSNSRLDEIQAAVLGVKLPMLDEWNARRRDIAARYSRTICHPKIATPTVRGEEYVAHLYVIRTADREKLRQHLIAARVPSDVHYPTPDYRQPCYASLFPDLNLSVTEQHCAEVLTLPCFPEMTNAEVDMIADCINTWER